MTAPDRPASERLQIVGDWLVEDVGRHTCGTDPGGHYGAHEPGCGLEPLIPLDALDEQMRARSRFAARIVGPAEPGSGAPAGMRVVELYAGDRYEYPAGRPSPRRPVASLRLTDEQAADLILALGEPDAMELPERLRPRDPWSGAL